MPSRSASAYHAAALLVLNTLLVFVAANLVAYVALWASGALPPAPGSEAYEAARRSLLQLPAFRVGRFFPGYTDAQVAKLMEESWARPPLYEPFAQFKERPWHGQFVNVDPNGFRRGRDQGPWPPDPHAVNVFVFGGSTTFGMGLPDDQTVPSHLQDVLAHRRPGVAVRVYNFGAGYYFSTQERVQFEQLLLAGVVPDVAVFVDGLNDFFQPDGVPALTSRLARVLSDPVPRPAHPYLELLRQLPLGVAATRVQAWATRRPLPSAASAPPPRAEASPGTVTPAERATIAAVIARYLGNKRMIEAVAAAHGIHVAFAWQPVPTYKYDLAHHASHPQGFGRVEITRAGYPEMARVAQAGAGGPNFVWCADIQEGRREELYLDLVHYAPRMARRVAACIAKGLLHRHLLAKRTNVPAAPTV
jgi:hypothetical protein